MPWKSLVSFTHLASSSSTVLIKLLVLSAVDRNDEEGEDDIGIDGAEGGRKQKRKKGEFILEVDAYGLPVIPAFDSLNLESKKSLIRSFLTKHYSECHKSCTQTAVHLIFPPCF